MKGGMQDMTLGERIVEYRAKERINMQEFADRCGVSKQTVYMIETGQQDPNRVTVAKIELVLGKEG